MTCYYCHQEGDLRPYGPEGSSVCLSCIRSDPEREKAAQEAFIGQIETALLALADGSGLVVLDTDTGDVKVMTAEQIAEYGGLPDESAD